MENIKDMRPMNRVDFHSHILPCIDDGSQSEAQSYEMLRQEKAHGVGKVLVTPHFYPDEPSPRAFIEKREAAYEKLMTYIKGRQEELPTIIQGAEVLLGVETADLEDLKLLAIEGTDYILIELPYAQLQEWMYESIEKIRVVHHLIPVIAHVERYVSFQKDLNDIHRLMSMEGVLGQVNTRAILDPKTRGLCQQLIGYNLVHVIGSDAHRVRHLKELDRAYGYISKKHGEIKIETLHQQAAAVLRNEKISKPVPKPLRRLWGRFYL